jgi:hypothetical protein
LVFLQQLVSIQAKNENVILSTDELTFTKLFTSREEAVLSLGYTQLGKITPHPPLI